MRDFLKRYRELIVIGSLLAATIVVWLAYRKDGRNLNTLDRAVLTVTAPVSRAVNAAAFYVIDVFHGVADLRKVRGRNEELLRKIFVLEGQLAEFGELRAENERLRTLVGFEAPESSTLVPARIIGEGLGRNGLTVTIDRGSFDGVRPNMAVVTRNGVVGRISSVAGGVSSVVLLSDQQALIPVRVQRSRTRATVRGRGAGVNFTLERLERTGDVADGDLLVTSGTDGVFPKGIPVGRVTALNRPDHGMFLTASVIPSVDLTCPDSVLEEVFVITSFAGQDSFRTAERGEQQEESAASSGAGKPFETSRGAAP